MVFMAADNNLEGGTEVDVNEMEAVGSTDDVAILVEADRIGKYSQHSEWQWEGTKRFYIQKDSNPKMVSSPVLQDVGEIDSASPEALLDFVRWCKQIAPAERYALILWNHGTGWKEISPDVYASMDEAPVLSPELTAAMHSISYNISYDNSSNTSMDIPSLQTTLAKVADILGQPIDLLGFDACLMQMLEVAYAAAPVARFQVGSTDLEPDRGWPYDTILRALAAQPTMDGRKLGELIVSSYKASYQSGSQGNVAVTLSLLDLSKVKEFTQTLGRLTAAMKSGIAEIDTFEQARDETLKYVYKDYLDLGHFLKLLSSRSNNPDVKKEAAATYEALVGSSGSPGLVAANAYTGVKYKEARGLSIFFPERSGFRAYKKRYAALSFARQGGWFDFLEEFETPSLPYLKIVEAMFVDANQDGRIAAGEEVKVKLKVKNFGKKAASAVSLTAQTSSSLLDRKSYAASPSGLPAPGKEAIIDAFSFTVDGNAPENSEVSLLFTLSGEGIPPSTFRSTFFIKTPFSTSGHVLLVLTDGFSPASPVLQAMFTEAKIKFDLWDRMLDGDLKPEVLKRYLDGWVFISSQDSSDQQQLTKSEIEALSGFLKLGGKVVLSGQDLAFSLRDNAFLRDFCRIAFVQDDINVHVLSGVGGFAKNATFQIFGGDGANNQKWPDEVDPVGGAKVLMKYNEGARDIANDKDMNGPDLKPGSLSRGIKSSGAAAVAVNDGYRLMFFAFGIEAINAASQRQSLLADIQTFMNPPVETQVRDLAATSHRRTTRAPRSSRERLEDIDLLSSLESRLTRTIKQRMETDPSFGRRILETIEGLPAASRGSIPQFEKTIRTLLEFQNQHGTVNSR
ncbi:MAG: Clostripain [Candidatus Ozemobacter sibiricus]|uniref:Clostripain n=1 Tax=Candidatus Ozemobacter sibiricus TaxID=2268124 RepID=A0A367ZTF4_9BACT|nr:MAG: Clostripain [Candidatus Ozemobacter sibiricus]